MLRILLLTPCVPVPPNTGGKLRSYHIIRGLAERNHLTVFSFAGKNRLGEDEDGSPIPISGEWGVCPIGSGMFLKQLASPLYSDPFIVQHYKSRRFRSMVLKTLDEGEWDLLYLDTLLMSSYGSLSDIPAVLDLRDVFSTYHREAGTLSENLVASLYHRIQQRKHATLLAERLGRFDSVLVCTHTDAQQLLDIAPDAPVQVVPNGVDSDYFQPTGAEVEPASLVFVGSMDYFPNVDGLLRFVSSVFPVLEKRFPEIRLYVVGRNPAREIRQLNDGDRIIVTGEVTDIRPYVARASVGICPTRIPTGIQNKILQSMAMGKPVVCTDAASIGSDTPPPGLFVAHNDGEFVDVLHKLLADPARTQSIGLAAREAIARRYRWTEVIDETQRILENLSRAPIVTPVEA